MNRYTPGPLHVTVDNSCPFSIRTRDASGQCVFVRDMPAYSTKQKSAAEAIAGLFMGKDQEKAIAMNVRAVADEILRAAAPDLLEACREMLEEMQVWEDEQGEHPAATKARAAIAKATGGKQ